MPTDNDPPSPEDRPTAPATSGKASDKPVRHSTLLAEMAARLDDNLRAAGYKVKNVPPSKGFVATFPSRRKPSQKD